MKSDPVHQPSSQVPTNGQWRTRNWKYILWVAGAAIGSILWLDFWLALANVKFLLDLVPIEPVAEGSQSAAVTAGATGTAGIVGLLTFFLTREQKERHQTANERIQRDLSETQKLEAQFSQLAKDFSANSTLERVNAAIGLGEIARVPDPRMLHGGQLRSENDQYGSAKNEDNFPMFRRALTRLCSALTLWKDAESRSHASQSILELAEWSKDDGTTEPLLHLLVNLVAEANRRACAQMRAPLISCTKEVLVSEAITDPDAVGVLVFEKLKPILGTDISAARSKVLFPRFNDFNSYVLTEARLSEVGTEGWQNALLSSWNTLDETRSLLCGCIRQLSHWPLANKVVSDRPSRHRLLRRRRLYLDRVFLRHSSFPNCNLQYSVCSESDFYGCKFTATDMKGSLLNDACFAATAILDKCDLSYTSLQSADFESATVADSEFDSVVGPEMILANGTWRNVTITNSNLTLSFLNWSKLYACDFSSSFLVSSDLSRCVFAECKMHNTKVAGTSEIFLREPPTFALTELGKLDFREYKFNHDNADDFPVSLAKVDQHTQAAFKKL